MQKNKMVYFGIFIYVIAIYSLLPFSLHASTHNQLTDLEKKITSIEGQLGNPFLTQPNLQNIELDIKIVQTKIQLVQNSLRMHNTNPFLPPMANEIEKKIQNLIINFNQKKSLFLLIN